MRYRLPMMAGILLLAMSAQGGQSRPVADADDDPPLAVRRIANEQGMHEAARANGGMYVINYDMSRAFRARARSALELVDSASLIVVGRVQAGEPRMHSISPMIDTIYPILVSETVKGDTRSVVKVRVPGGRVTFADGTSAEVRTHFSLRVGDTYVLFLLPVRVGVGTDPTDVAEGVQVLTAGLQSVVNVSTGRTQASAGPEHAIRAQQEDRVAAEFLNEVRALAHRGR